MALLAMKVTLTDGSEVVVEADSRVDTVDEEGNRIIRLMKNGEIIQVFKQSDVQEPIQGLTHDL